MLRSSTTSVKWDLCIFCQDIKPKETLSSVTTFKMIDQILAFSKYDQEAHVRLAGISDFIAAEGKYHPNCYKKFQRNATKAKEGAGKNDLAMEWLISEIRVCAKKGNVLQLSEVYNRYCELAEKANIEVPASFRNRRTTLKEKLSYMLKSHMTS